MAMPSKVWVGQPPHDCSKVRVWLKRHVFSDGERGSDNRADIAEDLARALEAMGDDRVSDAEFNSMRNHALARYHALTH